MTEGAEGDYSSLLPGRRTAPLEEHEVVTVANTFRGITGEIEARYDESKSTGFRLVEEDGESRPVILFSADIYPGPNITNPNSALSMRAAVAHELSHFHRWRDNLELPWGQHRHLDEALTSLDALMRFGRDHLSPHEMEQLAADATHRLQLLGGQLIASEDAAALDGAETPEVEPGS